jgi:hypothetical protein
MCHQQIAQTRRYLLIKEFIYFHIMAVAVRLWIKNSFSNIYKKLQCSISFGEGSMLETSQERVKLLKAGVDIKTIENLYIMYISPSPEELLK